MHFRQLHHLTVCICFILESVSPECPQKNNILGPPGNGAKTKVIINNLSYLCNSLRTTSFYTQQQQEQIRLNIIYIFVYLYVIIFNSNPL